MKTQTGFCIFGLLVIATLGAWQGLTGDTLYHQTQNKRRASEFVPVVRAKLDAFPEFQQIRVSAYTAAGGSLLINGEVPSEADVQRVREIVERTMPPVEVVYQLIPTNIFR